MLQTTQPQVRTSNVIACQSRVQLLAGIMEPSTLTILALTVMLSPSTAAFPFGVCNTTVHSQLAQNQSMLGDPSIFHYPGDPNNLELTYSACQDLCDTLGNGIYLDCGPRLAAWVLPTIILISSMQLPPLVWYQKAAAILRCLGNMIRSLKILVAEILFFECCIEQGGTLAVALSTKSKSMRNRDKDNSDEAAVGAAEVTWILHALTKSDSCLTLEAATSYLRQVITETPDLQSLEELERTIRDASKKISQIRTRSMWKLRNAVFWYIIGIVLTMVPQVAQATPSGGMMASMLLLSPLLLLVSLSNAIGEYSNVKWVCSTLSSFTGDIRRSETGGTRQTPTPLDSDFLERLTYPDTRLGLMTKLPLRKRGAIVCLFLLHPLAAAFTGTALGMPPAYFNERDVVVIALLLVWVFSAWLTDFVSRRQSGVNHSEPALDLERSESGRRRWLRRWMRQAIIIKDTAIAIAVPTILAGMTCGWLTSCKMWTGYWWHGPQRARMPLNPRDDFWRNSYVTFPILAALSLGLHMIAAIFVRCCFFKRVFRVIEPGD